jgi:hypothetical protein
VSKLRDSHERRFDRDCQPFPRRRGREAWSPLVSSFAGRSPVPIVGWCYTWLCFTRAREYQKPRKCEQELAALSLFAGGSLDAPLLRLSCLRCSRGSTAPPLAPARARGHTSHAAAPAPRARAQELDQSAAQRRPATDGSGAAGAGAAARARTRLGAINGSRATCSTSASASRRARYGDCLPSAGLSRRRAVTRSAGRPFFAAKRRPRSPATSSRSRRPRCAVCTCSSSSSSAVGASTSPGAPRTRLEAGSFSRRATSASPPFSRRTRFLIHDRDTKFSAGFDELFRCVRNQGHPHARTSTAGERLRGEVRPHRPQ